MKIYFTSNPALLISYKIIHAPAGRTHPLHLFHLWIEYWMKLYLMGRKFSHPHMIIYGYRVAFVYDPVQLVHAVEINAIRCSACSLVWQKVTVIYHPLILATLPSMHASGLHMCAWPVCSLASIVSIPFQFITYLLWSPFLIFLFLFVLNHIKVNVIFHKAEIISENVAHHQ